MKIKLLAYNGVEHYVEIPDDTEKLLITIVSGDMVMHSPFHYDTGTPRLANFFDGILDIGGIIYFLSIIAVFLVLTEQTIVKRRWS